MGVELLRVDERLVHGQVMVNWVKNHWINRIILVDDTIFIDEFAKQVLSMSAPVGVTVTVLPVADVSKTLREIPQTDHVLLLFKQIKFAYDLFMSGYEFKELNIGNSGGLAGRKLITKGVYLSDEEVQNVREMNAAGITIYIQKLPQDQKINIMDLKSGK